MSYHIYDMKKLEIHCDPEVNDHKRCSGKVIENEKISPCECGCHLINEPHILFGFGF